MSHKITARREKKEEKIKPRGVYVLIYYKLLALSV